MSLEGGSWCPALRHKAALGATSSPQAVGHLSPTQLHRSPIGKAGASVAPPDADYELQPELNEPEDWEEPAAATINLHSAPVGSRDNTMRAHGNVELRKGHGKGKVSGSSKDATLSAHSGKARQAASDGTTHRSEWEVAAAAQAQEVRLPRGKKGPRHQGADTVQAPIGAVAAISPERRSGWRRSPDDITAGNAPQADIQATAPNKASTHRRRDGSAGDPKASVQTASEMPHPAGKDGVKKWVAKSEPLPKEVATNIADQASDIALPSESQVAPTEAVIGGKGTGRANVKTWVAKGHVMPDGAEVGDQVVAEHANDQKQVSKKQSAVKQLPVGGKVGTGGTRGGKWVPKEQTQKVPSSVVENYKQESSVGEPTRRQPIGKPLKTERHGKGNEVWTVKKETAPQVAMKSAKVVPKGGKLVSSRTWVAKQIGS